MLNLRNFLTALAMMVVVSSVLLAQSDPLRPNIVYILADDLGYGDIQALNPDRGRIQTPHLDRLAGQGMIFTDAHSGSSVCTPTRYGLLTGRYAWRTRLQAGVLDGGNDEPLIAAKRWTVAGLLKQAGYRTACIGKWHLGFQSESPTGKGREAKGSRAMGLPVGARILGGPTTRGFDEFFGCSNARTMASLIEGERVIEMIEPIAMLPRLQAKAVGYIEQRAAAADAGQPFFLYLPLTSPHTPIVPSVEWLGRSGLGDYADFVMMTDAVVGSVLEALERSGVADNTLVFFTSDNGCSPAANTQALEKQGHFASERYRGYKADIWEGGHRVAFLARWPGKIAPGTRSSQLICHSDLMATLADLLSIPLPANAAEDSFSILPVLLGKDSSPVHEAVVHHSIDGRFAIRQGRWKLALCSGSGGWGSPKDAAAREQGLPDHQLYDLVADPGETRNLYLEHPEVAEALKALLQRWIADGRSTPGPRQANDVEVLVQGRAKKDPAKKKPASAGDKQTLPAKKARR
jgi:arylsulfatase A